MGARVVCSSRAEDASEIACRVSAAPHVGAELRGQWGVEMRARLGCRTARPRGCRTIPGWACLRSRSYADVTLALAVATPASSVFAHDFLVLSLLFAVPGALVFALRRDLRRVQAIAIVASLPFAATEFMFYPSYWKPKFLFDLADRIGFGIEDLLFVAGLGAFTTTAYPFFFRQRLVPLPDGDARRAGIAGTDELRAAARSAHRAKLERALYLLGGALGSALLLHFAGVRMIYGSSVIMLVVSSACFVRRRDLALPCLLGGLASLLVYTLLCLAFGALIPGVFQLAWNLEQFSNVFVLGVPLEELMYGFCSGYAATVFYPFVLGERFVAKTA